MPAKQKTPQAPQSLKDSGIGYPNIEELLETEGFDKINKSFSEAYDKLEIIMKDRAGGLKKQKGAQKAMKAYELTTELMNELLKIKYQIIKMRDEQAKKQQKK